MAPTLAAQAQQWPIPVITLPAESLPDDFSSALPLDDDEMARALERALVLTGGFVLPMGRYEITPGLDYDYTRRRGLVLLPGAVAQQDIRIENLLGSVALKAGLPWTSQLELSLPYAYQAIESVTGGTSETIEDHGSGDIQLGLSKQILNHVSSKTGLIASLAYRWATGDSGLDSPNGRPAAALGAGFDSWGATMTAVKRTDPLVFLGALSFSQQRPSDINGSKVEPGNTLGIGLQAILAASPDVSLRAGASLSRLDEIKRDGSSISGSGQQIANLDLGVAVVLSRSLLFDLSFSAGLTQDAPDFGLGLSFPFRI